jgi:protein-L-isoaspartate(D-aspartate) O-methyltransferase
MAEADFAVLRHRMVAQQLEGRGLADRRVLEAMRTVPRHLFVPTGSEMVAYDDRPLPIGEGQTISQPFMVGIMTAALALAPEARVLEIGTGSGYQAAVLAFLAREVFTIERHPPLAERAREALDRAGITNVHVRVGDGTEGWPEESPFDGIIVTAGAPSAPDTLIDQLADGGRLVVPIGPADHQLLTILTRRDDRIERETSEACVFVPLVGRYGWSDRNRDKL